MSNPAPKRPSQFTISDKQWRAISSMADEPEIAVQIAVFLSIFGSIELSLPALLSSLTKLDRSTCEHLLGVNTSFSQRLLVVETASLALPLEPDWAAFYDEVMSETKFLEGRRNRYCHAQYTSTDKEGELRMLAFRTDGARPTKEEIITIETVKKDCARAERVSLALWHFLRGSSHELKPLRNRGQKLSPSSQIE